jgi:acyl-CoA thioesterase FadM
MIVCETQTTERVVQILKKSNNRLLAEANSLWCLISSTNNRPARIPDNIKSVFVPEVS